MRYSNIDYTVLYVDPSKSTNGTGTTPATAMNTLPASIGSIADRTCYLVSAHKRLDPAAGARFHAARRPCVACGCL